MNTDNQWSKQEACFGCVTLVWLAVNHNTSATSHWQVSLEAVDQIYVFHEAMSGCKNLKIHQRLALKM